ncbi:phospholipase [Siphonobacter sp. BAB-5405]|nr:dienelactone hydrolase family protein [Siphonobacter sp. BAB-5405]PMD90795.1 phospholipase [Siphonobacter sp. BAB-5405]
MYMHQKQVFTSGTPIQEAQKAIIMIHGRGGSAEDIASLSRHLHLDGMAIYAPQATRHSWYPYSFLAPVEENQPALDSALDSIDQVVNDLVEAGITTENIYFLGFSQGACLTLEYTARHAKRYGGIIALTGGLIGETLATDNYEGDFAGTPVFISTGNPDPHVPVSRVEESVSILEDLNASVTSRIYPGRMHTISPDEINLVNQHIL